MKFPSYLSWRRTRAGRGVDHEGPTGELNDVPAPPIASAAQVVTSGLATKALSFVLMVCVVLGPVGFVVGLSALRVAGRPAATSAAVATDNTQAVGAAGEMAAEMVTAWLMASRDSHAALDVLYPSATAQLPVQGAAVAQTRVVQVLAAGEHVWSVTVEAVFVCADKVPRQGFFAVPVWSDGATARVITLPAPVAGPVVGGGTQLDHPNLVSTESALGQSVQAFLTAYLTASGDVGRYLAPGAVINAPAAIYTGVKVTSVAAAGAVSLSPADGEQVTVLVAAQAAIKDQTLPVAYTLTLRARATRWEISGIDLAPVLKAEPTSTATSTPARAQEGSVPASNTPTPTATPSK